LRDWKKFGSGYEINNEIRRRSDGDACRVDDRRFVEADAARAARGAAAWPSVSTVANAAERGAAVRSKR